MNIYLQGLTMGLAYVAPIGLQNLREMRTQGYASLPLT